MSQASHPPKESIPQTDTAFLVGKFIQDCIDRGLSPQTIRSYNDFLSKFIRTYPELPIDPEVLASFIASFTSGDERRHGCYRVLRTFYGFIDNRFELITNPFFHKVRPPKRLRKEKKALTLAELKNLLEYPGHDAKVRTILHVLSDTGIRIGELANMKRDDIGADNTLRVTGKTGQRIVPLSPEVRFMLLELRPAEDGRLFPNMPHWCSEVVSRAFKKAGIKGSAHTLRHTFCSTFRGSDQALMAITGHKSYSMVLNYSHRKEERAQEEHRQHGPLARLYGATQQPTASNIPDDTIIKLATELASLKEKVEQLQKKVVLQGNGNLPLPLDSPGQYKIVQISPANGYKAVFAEGDDKGMELERVPLACWAVVDFVFETPWGSTDVAREIRGFIPTNDGIIEPVADMQGFLGYEAPGREEDDKFIGIYEQLEEVKP